MPLQGQRLPVCAGIDEVKRQKRDTHTKGLAKMHNGPLTEQDKHELYRGILTGAVLAPMLYPVAVLFFLL